MMKGTDNMSGVYTFGVRTGQAYAMIDITGEVQNIVSKSGVKNGICIVFVPHTTAGITINENADPDVIHDILDSLNNVFPVSGNYRHVEGNSHAHIKASLMGSSCSVIIEGGKLNLGIWQGIYFCEFDGPRSRKISIQIIKG